MKIHELLDLFDYYDDPQICILGTKSEKEKVQLFYDKCSKVPYGLLEKKIYRISLINTGICIVINYYENPNYYKKENEK